MRCQACGYDTVAQSLYSYNETTLIKKNIGLFEPIRIKTLRGDSIQLSILIEDSNPDNYTHVTEKKIGLFICPVCMTVRGL
jgi:hypothetical protein